MSHSYSGGSATYTQYSLTKSTVPQILQRFIEDEFSNPSETISRISEEDGLYIITAEDSENTSPATLEHERDDELQYYGAFISPATEHPVQTIWEYQFEIRQKTDGRVFIRVSDWSGTTVDTWKQRVSTKGI